MEYQITKVRNGYWLLNWESGAKSEHSTKEGAERMIAILESQKNKVDTVSPSTTPPKEIT